MKRPVSGPDPVGALVPVARGCGGAGRRGARGGARPRCCGGRRPRRSCVATRTSSKKMVTVLAVARTQTRLPDEPPGHRVEPLARRRRGCPGGRVASFQTAGSKRRAGSGVERGLLELPEDLERAAVGSCRARASRRFRRPTACSSRADDVDVLRLAAAEEVPLHVLHAGLDLALLLRVVDRRRVDLEPVVTGQLAVAAVERGGARPN